jgi:hypothetical protein
LFIHEINRHGVDVSNINLNSVEEDYRTADQTRYNPHVVVANWNRTLSMAEFVIETYHNHLAISMQFVSVLAIVVAVGTGIAMSLGFGPAAGISGLSSSLSGSSTAATVTGTALRDRIVHAALTGMAHGITRFLRESYREMSRIAHSSAPADAQRNATRFWENNAGRMYRIVGLSLTAAAFNYSTSFIPGGNISSRSDLTMGTLARMIGDRFANNITGAIQSIYEDIAQGNPIDWEQIQNDMVLSFTTRGIS